MFSSFRRTIVTLLSGSSKRQSGVIGMVLLLPIAVAMEGNQRDSSFTSVGVSGGFGSYAQIARGCEGQVLSKHDVPYRDATVSVDHKGSGPAQIGAKAGWYAQRGHEETWEETPNMEAFYVNPNVALEWRRFGIGVGALLSDARLRHVLIGDEGSESEGSGVLPTGHLRFGVRKTYLSLHLLEGEPLVSGGGLMAIGVGIAPRPDASVWFGMSTAGPYDGAGQLVEAILPVKNNLHLKLGARHGTSEGLTEYGLSLGLVYRFGSKR
jgi:hypothetical protein